MISHVRYTSKLLLSLSFPLTPLPLHISISIYIYISLSLSICISIYISLSWCNIPGGMLSAGSGCHHACVWECMRWMFLYLFHLLTQVLLAGYCCVKWRNFIFPYSHYRISRKSNAKQNVQLCVSFNSDNENSVFTGVDILTHVYL